MSSWKNRTNTKYLRKIGQKQRQKVGIQKNGVRRLADVRIRKNDVKRKSDNKHEKE